MEGAERALAPQLQVQLVSGTLAMIGTVSATQAGDALTFNEYGEVRLAKEDDVVIGYSTQNLDPWPKDCVVITEEHDASD